MSEIKAYNLSSEAIEKLNSLCRQLNNNNKSKVIENLILNYRLTEVQANRYHKFLQNQIAEIQTLANE